MPLPETLTLTWRRIDIQIDFKASTFEAYKQTYGVALAHIEVKADERLPFTETGYRSMFLPLPEVESYGGVTAFVEAWLEDAAQSKAWKKYDQDRQQLRLF